MLRAVKTRGLARLDALKGALLYAPITTRVMLRAAESWAAACKAGRKSAPDVALDADVITGGPSLPTFRPITARQ